MLDKSVSTIGVGKGFGMKEERCVMKLKNLRLSIIIWSVAVLAIAACAVIYCIAKKPTVTEKVFDFSITYEFQGETVTIEDVYSVHYVRNGGYTHSKERIYSGKIGGKEDADRTTYVLQDNENGTIVLHTNLCPDCLMGDPQYDCRSDGPMEPQFIYDDVNGYRFTDEESLLAQGVKLISWDYPTPIENSFVFSHMSILSGEVVVPMALIGLLALLATVITVKKENDLVYTSTDHGTIVLNFVSAFIVVPFFALVTWLFDIVGNNEKIFNQMLYFTAALTALGIAVSVFLRRKGFSKGAFWVLLGGPAYFAILVLLDSIKF